ncbi:hypothetical protein EDEG_00928 [Edhazardia aedis USNM 41457]|uniref:Uncharacterized protein n=1 Tax=Edhazardia aedis (strain USNM 41457) TaxID=1003232 RepID=J9DQU0_EDHAE|nr:hypothetical protein EDEG_00928 [Edhazardia aedis USNM 41457]|eukprot:EJW04935.1 hypothetical protein EDEG_00928 [Edhazardia aedis USNM 41457]
MPNNAKRFPKHISEFIESYNYNDLFLFAECWPYSNMNAKYWDVLFYRLIEESNKIYESIMLPVENDGFEKSFNYSDDTLYFSNIKDFFHQEQRNTNTAFSNEEQKNIQMTPDYKEKIIKNTNLNNINNEDLNFKETEILKNVKFAKNHDLSNINERMFDCRNCNNFFCNILENQKVLCDKNLLYLNVTNEYDFLKKLLSSKRPHKQVIIKDNNVLCCSNRLKNQIDSNKEIQNEETKKDEIDKNSYLMPHKTNLFNDNKELMPTKCLNYSINNPQNMIYIIYNDFKKQRRTFNNKEIKTVVSTMRFIKMALNNINGVLIPDIIRLAEKFIFVIEPEITFAALDLISTFFLTVKNVYKHNISSENFNNAKKPSSLFKLSYMIDFKKTIKYITGNKRLNLLKNQIDEIIFFYDICNSAQQNTKKQFFGRQKIYATKGQNFRHKEINNAHIIESSDNFKIEKDNTIINIQKDIHHIDKSTTCIENKNCEHKKCFECLKGQNKSKDHDKFNNIIENRNILLDKIPSTYESLYNDAYKAILDLLYDVYLSEYDYYILIYYSQVAFSSSSSYANASSHLALICFMYQQKHKNNSNSISRRMSSVINERHTHDSVANFHERMRSSHSASNLFLNNNISYTNETFNEYYNTNFNMNNQFESINQGENITNFMNFNNEANNIALIPNERTPFDLSDIQLNHKTKITLDSNYILDFDKNTYNQQNINKHANFCEELSYNYDPRFTKYFETFSNLSISDLNLHLTIKQELEIFIKSTNWLVKKSILEFFRALIKQKLKIQFIIESFKICEPFNIILKEIELLKVQNILYIRSFFEFLHDFSTISNKGIYSFIVLQLIPALVDKLKFEKEADFFIENIKNKDLFENKIATESFYSFESKNFFSKYSDHLDIDKRITNGKIYIVYQYFFKFLCRLSQQNPYSKNFNLFSDLNVDSAVSCVDKTIGQFKMLIKNEKSISYFTRNFDKFKNQRNTFNDDKVFENLDTINLEESKEILYKMQGIEEIYNNFYSVNYAVKYYMTEGLIYGLEFLNFFFSKSSDLSRHDVVFQNLIESINYILSNFKCFSIRIISCSLAIITEYINSQPLNIAVFEENKFTSLLFKTYKNIKVIFNKHYKLPSTNFFDVLYNIKNIDKDEIQKKGCKNIEPIYESMIQSNQILDINIVLKEIDDFNNIVVHDDPLYLSELLISSLELLSALSLNKKIKKRLQKKKL